MASVRQQQDEIIAQFAVPMKGTWNNIAVHQIPQDAIYGSLNVFIRLGKLRSRPGFNQFTDTTFVSNIIGGAMATTPTDKALLAVAPDRLNVLHESSKEWDVSNIYNFAYDDQSVADIAFYARNNATWAVIAVEGRSLAYWDSSTGGVQELTGSNIPHAKSVCVAGSRIITLTSPHTINWSNVNNPNVFDPLAYALKAQTGDNGILVESLSALSFVLYKERSIYLARAQAGIDEGTAFAFQEPIYSEGPAGIYALVNVNGTHIYMTKNGRIALFDGTSYPKWIADGVWFYLQNDMDQSRTRFIRGVYDYRLHTVTFFYPRKDVFTNNLQGMVIINLPFEGLDIGDATGPKVFLGVCQLPVTHACERRFDYAIDRSIIFTALTSTVNDRHCYVCDEEYNLDGEKRFTCMFQTGLQPMPDAVHKFVTIESFFERGSEYGSVFIEPVVSDALESVAGYIPKDSGQYIDLMFNPVREYKGFQQQVRFFGVRYSWDSSNYVRYAGATVIATMGQRYQR